MFVWNGLFMTLLLCGISIALTLICSQGMAMNNTNESLARYIPPHVYNHQETGKIFDFRIDLAKEKIQDSQNLASLALALARCLSATGVEALCGAHSEVSEVYFDRQGTTAHLFLNRALEIGIWNEFDFKDVILEVLKVKADKTQRLALQAVRKLSQSQWVSIDQKILPDNEVFYYVKILEDRALGKPFRLKIRKRFRQVIARSLFDADQLTQVKASLSGATITKTDLQYVCLNVDRKDILFGKIKRKLGIEKECQNI
jgi:hypothetical protein